MVRNENGFDVIIKSVVRAQKSAASVCIAVYNSSHVNLGRFCCVSILGNKLYLESKTAKPHYRKDTSNPVYAVQTFETRQLVDASSAKLRSALLNFEGAYRKIHLDIASGQYYVKLDEKMPLIGSEAEHRTSFKKNSCSRKKTAAATETKAEVPVKVESPAPVVTPPQVPSKPVVKDKREQMIDLLLEAVIGEDYKRANTIAEMYMLMFV